MRYKGKYVCLVEIDFDINPGKGGFLPFDDLKTQICGKGLTEEIRKLISDELLDASFAKAQVIKQYDEFYKEGDNDIHS